MNVGKFNTLKLQIGFEEELMYGLNINSEITNYSERGNKYNIKFQVFRWDGQPVKEYMLDNRLITSIAIDDVYDRIYAYSPLEPERSYKLQYSKLNSKKDELKMSEIVVATVVPELTGTQPITRWFAHPSDEF